MGLHGVVVPAHLIERQLGVPAFITIHRREVSP